MKCHRDLHFLQYSRFGNLGNQAISSPGRCYFRLFVLFRSLTQKTLTQQVSSLTQQNASQVSLFELLVWGIFQPKIWSTDQQKPGLYHCQFRQLCVRSRTFFVPEVVRNCVERSPACSTFQFTSPVKREGDNNTGVQLQRWKKFRSRLVSGFVHWAACRFFLLFSDVPVLLSNFLWSTATRFKRTSFAR